MNHRSYWGGRSSLALGLLVLLTLGVGSGQARPLARGDTVEISMYSGTASKPALEILVRDFEKANSGIDVTVTYPPTSDGIIQLETTQLAAGNAPDILATWPGCGTAISICKLAPAGHLANMPNKPWAKRSSSIAISTSKYGGGLFAYSPAITFEGLWTNDSLFQSMGLKIPQTFPQLLDVCRKAKGRGTTPVILAASGSLVMQQLIGAFALTTVPDYSKWLQKLKAKKVTFEGTPGWHTALQKMIDLNNAGCYQPGSAGTTSGAAATQFAQGQALTYANMTSKKGEITGYQPRFGFSQHPFPITGKPKHSVAGVGTFRGYAEPRYLTTLTPGFEFLNHRLRIQSLFDWRGGNKWYNNTERIRCTRPNCNGMFNPSASMEEQAMVVAANFNAAKTLDGFLQPGGFVKWREASATLQLPQMLYSRSRIRNASLVFTARNLKKWTNYRGTDPESDFAVGEGGDAPSEFQTFAQPTYFIFRLNLGF